MKDKITADESLQNQLNGATVAIEICDADGKTLGHFVPPEVYRSLLHQAAMYPPDLTTEELQRGLSEGPGKPLAQIWKELGRT